MASNNKDVWNPKVRTFFHDGEADVENRMIPTDHIWYKLRVEFAKDAQRKKVS